MVALSLSAVACAAPVESTSTGAEASSTSSEEVVARTAHFDVSAGEDGLFTFQFVAANGAKLLRSPGFATAAEADAGIASVLAYGVDANNLVVQEDELGAFFFVVRGEADAVLATSGTYATRDSAERGARAVRALLWIAHNAAKQG